MTNSPSDVFGVLCFQQANTFDSLCVCAPVDEDWWKICLNIERHVTVDEDEDDGRSEGLVVVFVVVVVVVDFEERKSVKRE